ncbi:MAG: DUF2809 domain-containing protein [Phycisphaerales bacterium]|nr:DUF2809 domain-containing protein [Phycisphaerales bacterium]
MTRSFAPWLFTRRWLILAAVLTVAFGLASRALLPATPAKVAGVALYATLVYWLVRATAARRDVVGACKASALVAPAALALAISWGVEFLQLTRIPATLSALHPVLRLVFGEVFSATDLIWYAIGVVAGALLEFGVRRAGREADHAAA